MFLRMLIAVLLLIPGVARAEWIEATTKHFVIYSNDSRKNITDFAVSLERYDRAMRIFRQIPDGPVAPSDRVTIFVLRSLNSIDALGQRGAAGFYIGRAGGPVAFTIREEYRNGGATIRENANYKMSPGIVLRHEYAHHFMFSSYGAAAMPLWFTEGFAEFHATAIENDDGSIVFGQMPGYRAANLTASGSPCSAKKILAAPELRKLELCYPSDLYAYGWLMVHYLTFTEGGPAKMAAYLTALNSGKTPEEAAVGAFGDLDTLEKELSRHLHSRKLPAFIVPADQLKIETPKFRTLSAGEAATMDVRIQSKAGVDEKEAPGVYAEAVRAAAPYPNDPSAQLALAEAAFDAKHYDEAEAAAMRAVEAKPTGVTLTKALDYVGMAKMARAVEAKSEDPAVFHDARSWFAKANRNDPDDAEPLILFYRSYIVAGEPATDNALSGLVQAIRYAPYDRTTSFLLAYAYLSRGNLNGARNAISVLANDPDSEKRRERAGKIVDLIDAGDAEGAMAALLPWVKDPNYVDPDDKKD